MFDLKEVQCSGNRFEHRGFVSFYKHVCTSNIQICSLNYCKLELESQLIIPTFVKKASQMKLLSIEGVGLQDNIGEMVLQQVKSHPNLKFLNISNAKLGDRSCSALIDVLRENKQIEAIKYEQNL